MAETNYTAAPTAPRAGLRTRTVVGTALLAFVLGGGAVGYAVWNGLIPRQVTPMIQPAATMPPAAPAAPAAPVAQPETAQLASQQAALEARAAALSERLDTLDVMATMAAGNAARAEALLVAFAARRALDRGAPLGLLEDQLRLRFGNSQPNAVATVIDAARRPVTLGQLVAGLDALAPDLSAAPASLGTWDRIKQQVSGLFVIRRQSAPSPEPQVALRRARVLLEEGRSEEALNEVRRLPGAAQARDWFAAVRRYDSARRALDVLETTALIDREAPAAARPDKPATGPAPAPGPTASAAAQPAV